MTQETFESEILDQLEVNPLTQSLNRWRETRKSMLTSGATPMILESRTIDYTLVQVAVIEVINAPRLLGGAEPAPHFFEHCKEYFNLQNQLIADLQAIQKQAAKNLAPFKTYLVNLI
jgi:hypothetical protein